MVFEEIYTKVVQSFVNVIPNFLVAAVTLIVGFVVGKIVGKIVKEILVRLKVDEYTYIEEEKLSIKFSSVLSTILKWAVYLIFIQQAVDFLKVAIITQYLGQILALIPKLIYAGLALIVGYSLGIYIKEKVISTKTFYSDLVGKTVFFLILYFSVYVSLGFMGIPTALIENVLLVIIGSVGLGLAIAIGLGLKDVIGDIAGDYKGRFRNLRLKKR